LLTLREGVDSKGACVTTTLWIVFAVLFVLVLLGLALGPRHFWLPAAASLVIGLLIGAAAALGVTLMVGTKTPTPRTDNAAAMLNRVEYGDRR
jgi:hypothetical protein